MATILVTFCGCGTKDTATSSENSSMDTISFESEVMTSSKPQNSANNESSKPVSSVPVSSAVSSKTQSTTQEPKPQEVKFGNTLILGDSYSTFEGYIPEGNATYYGVNSSNNLTDVKRVEDTWWNLLMKETGSNLVLNDSYSGSTIGYTGYNFADYSGDLSFIYRLRKLDNTGFFQNNKVDTIFIFGGTNDSWCGAPIGDVKYNNILPRDCYSVLPAVCYLIKYAKEVAPKAKIYLIINSELKDDLTEGMITAAEHYKIKAVKLQGISKTDNHPNTNGMIAIKNQIIEAVK